MPLRSWRYDGARLLARLIKRFRRAREGNLAMMTALLLLPMIGITGLAIDYAAAVKTKGRLEQMAQVAATTAVITARNVLQVAGLNDNSLDRQALDEGARVGKNSLTLQLSKVSGVVVSAPNWTVLRTGNTLTASVTFDAGQTTAFAKIFGYNTFHMTVQGSMIVGLMDNPAKGSTAGSVADESWSTPPGSILQPSSTTTPLIDDWYSGTPATASPLLPAGGPPLPDGTATAALQIGDRNGSISPIISKKVYLPAGQYELRYWYKSTVVYPEYEPVYICGTVEAEMDWVTSNLVRAPTPSSWVQGNALPQTRKDSPQTSRAGVYLDPVAINPQLATAAPAANSFAIPPLTPNPVNNRIDICAYSSRWIQRSIPLTVTNPGYFWLSFVSEPPTGSNRNGFYLGRVQLCPGVCAGPLNNNWPWSAGTLLYADSFETPPKQAGAAFNPALSSFPASAQYELPPQWLAGRYGGVGVWNPASFAYAVNNPPRFDGPTSVLSTRLGIWLYRKMLLMPGVYRITFMAGLTRLPPTMRWCPTMIVNSDSGYTPPYALTDTSLPNTCNCPAGAITTVITSDEKVFAQQDSNINNTSPYFYRNNIDPPGSAMSDCHAYNTGTTDVYCVLVPRTQYYGFQLRLEGPYLTDVTSSPYPGTDLQLGSAGAYLDNLQVSLLSAGVKNKFTGTPADPGDFDDYQNKCFTTLAAASTTATVENIISGTAPVWPGYTKLQLTGVSVTAPSQ